MVKSMPLLHTFERHTTCYNLFLSNVTVSKIFRFPDLSGTPCIYRVRHIKCYRAIALKLLIISKNVSDKSFSIREGHHTLPHYFFYRGLLGLPKEDARSDDPRLVSTC